MSKSDAITETTGSGEPQTEELRFYCGLHHPGVAGAFERAFISINTIRTRRKPIECPDVVIDSGAFVELEKWGRYRHSVEEYATALRRLHDEGVVRITAAVAQDYMCEPFMLEKTGLTVEEHQRLSVERYDALLACGMPFPILPVLQGYAASDYVRHIRMYGDRLTPGMWVGVGSVCKRNSRPEQIVAVLAGIKGARPDLRLHGFGVKLTALTHSGVRQMLYSADSMAWSFAARKAGRSPNDPAEAHNFVARVRSAASKAIEPWQIPLMLE